MTDAGAATVAATATAGGSAGPLGESRTYVTPSNDFDAARFLLQAQFSATESEIASVRSLGYAGWLAKQFEVAPGTSAWDWLDQHHYAEISVGTYFATYPADFAMWWQLIHSPDTLRKRIALALSEIFVVSTNGMNSTWPGYLIASWWDMLSSNSFGNFRKLLEDVTLHPAMGIYLNTRGSQKENAAGRHPDENYARELMQLMTIGLVKLNADGTPITSGGIPVPTFDQDDVTNLARVFSGYDLDMTGTTYVSVPSIGGVSNTVYASLPMKLNAAKHSTYDVNFLGSTIAGSTEGNAARKMALDTLFNHANVGPFIGRQLIQRLVTSNPSAAYVGRVAAAFANNGNGVRGDIGATVAAVLLDQEARDPAGLTSNTFGHVREPMLRLVQWARTFGLVSAQGTWKIYDQSSPTSLGQSPMRSGSVFNFYRPGYVPPSTAIATAKMVAPEFQLINETSVSSYVNLMQTTIRYGLIVNAPAIPQYDASGPRVYDMTATYAVEKTLVTDASALVARLNLVLAAGQLSASTLSLMISALNATPVTAASTDLAKLDRISAAVLMVMASPEYLVQK